MTEEYLKSKGWTEQAYSLLPPQHERLILWRHPSKDWTVHFNVACELQRGMEMKEDTDGKS